MHSIDEMTFYQESKPQCHNEEYADTAYVQFDIDFLRGRSAYFANNTIQSTIIFSFSLVKNTFEFTTSKKVAP